VPLLRFSLTAPTPSSRALRTTNVLYRQLEDDIALYYRRIQNGKPPPPLGIFEYRTRQGDDLYSVAAQVNLPYEAIATVNHLDHPDSLTVGMSLLIPNMPGLFIPADPDRSLIF